MYGPYRNCNPYWDLIDNSGLLDIHTLISLRDLNLTLNVGGLWGHRANPNTLVEYFPNLFNYKALYANFSLSNMSNMAKW